ncbi:MAG: hypothetical protein ACERKN_04300 [Velocimicrobium sp.]
MGKLDSMIKCAQARNLLEEKQYQKAVQIIEKIDIEKIKSIMDLKTIGQVYIESKRFLDAREVYVVIYNKVQSRSVLYHLIYLSIQCGLIKEAETFFETYKKLDSDSVDVHILRFYLQKAKGTSRLDLISYIKKILTYDYLEEWAYELAKLYHKEEMGEACVEECSKIILWFGEGIIVEKAMLLKLYYVDGVDISSPKAIEETRNIAADLRIAADIVDRQDQERQDRDRVAKNEEEEEEIEEIIEEGIEQSTEETDNQREKVTVDTVEKSKKQQIIESIVAETLQTKEMPHFLIIGTNEDKIMEVTKSMIRELCDKKIIETPRIARILAKKVNMINMEDKSEQLEDSCLLIEEANELSLDSLQTLCQLMKRGRTHVVVGFVDDENGMKQLLNRNRKLKTLIKYELYV